MQGQILNGITDAYANVAVGWLEPVLAIAQQLFVMLATIEVAWSGIRWALAAQREQTLLAEMLRKLFILMVLYTIVVGAGYWMPFLIGGFVQAGAEVSGFNTINPSSLFEQGMDVAIEMYRQASEAYSWWTMPLWARLAPLFVVFAFTVLAGVLVLTLIESFIVISGGVLFLGFLGSRWTVTFAEGYLITAMRVGTKLFVLYLMIAVASQLPEQWLLLLGDRLNPATDLRLFLEIMAGAVILTLLVWQVPRFASVMIGHRTHFNLQNIHQGTDG